MANWAALQEQLMGKPVAKRAKHGIHFDNGDGSITANFAGKPVHYLDGAEWKAIDTKPILMGDGRWGCPHSPVRIATDGAVAIEGTTYTQRARLISGANVQVVDDHLVRTFANGEQRLFITEDGFRSEITLNSKPNLLQALYLIANVSGSLPQKYIQSQTTMTDAKGNIYTYDTAQNFKNWLEGAVYPVVIDPDFTVTSAAGDNNLYGGSGNENYGARTISVPATGTIVYRFDCSSVAAGSTISAGDFKFTKGAQEGSGTTDLPVYSITLANSDWVAGTNDGGAQTGSSCYNYKAYHPTTPTAWAGSAGCRTSGVDYEADALATISYNKSSAAYTQFTATLTTAGKTRIAGWFGATNTNYGVTHYSGEDRQFCLANHATAAYRPVLSVTYTAAGIAIPVAQYYYNRLRRN